jgi:hypothetical protein
MKISCLPLVALITLASSPALANPQECAKPVCVISLDNRLGYSYPLAVLRAGNQEINAIDVWDTGMGGLDQAQLKAALKKIRPQAQKLKDAGACGIIIDNLEKY